MHLDSFSGLDLLVALDARNVEAHLTGTLENCAVCAAVSNPHTICPAGRAIETTTTASHPPTVIEITDRLTTALGPSSSVTGRTRARCESKGR